MSPDLKHFLVENLQGVGYCVGFCGDGTNDCGALKSADVGLSLSEAEASVAAPFTSKQTDLDCVLRLIREGRAALVTSFCCFKYMALYSLIQFTSVSLLYSLAQNLSDFQFMYVDLVLIIPIAVLMGRSRPHPTIFHKRPTASLVSKKVLTSLIGQFFIQFTIQLVAFLWIRQQSWYLAGDVDIEQEIYLSMENSVVFLVSCYQYLIAAIVFTAGPPYQEPLWKNGNAKLKTVPYITLLFFLTALTSFITLSPPIYLRELLDLVDIPLPGRCFLFSLAIFNFFVSWISEKVLFPFLSTAIGIAIERAVYTKLDETEISIPPAKLAKMRKWKVNGKRYKIIGELFK